MNEVGSSLTVTAVIATLVSVLFAIAALYVSSRKRTQADSSNSIQTGPSADSFSPKTKKKAKTGFSDNAPPPKTPPSEKTSPHKSGGLVVATPTPGVSGVSSFNRLGPHGGVERQGGVKTDGLTKESNEYEWE